MLDRVGKMWGRAFIKNYLSLFILKKRVYAFLFQYCFENKKLRLYAPNFYYPAQLKKEREKYIIENYRHSHSQNT